MVSSKNKKAPATAIARAQMSNQTYKEGIDLMNNTTAAMTVPFHGANLALVEYNGQPYTPMKPIVEGMGLAWKPQFVKLQEGADRFGVTIMVIAAAGAVAMQEMLCMPLRKLPGWLMSISPNRVKNKAVRERVIRFQTECDDVLWDYWSKGEATNPRFSTKDERTPLKDAVNMLIGKSSNLSYSDAWQMVHQRFAIGSVTELTVEQLPAAVEYVHKIILEGQLLHKENLPAKQVSIQLDYPMADWIKRCLHPSVTPVESSPGRFRILPAHIGGGDGWSPTSYLIAELTRHGHETAAIRLEHLAMRHYLEWMGTTLWQIRLLTQNCRDIDAMQRALAAIECRANVRNLPPLVLPA